METTTMGYLGIIGENSCGGAPIPSPESPAFSLLIPRESDLISDSHSFLSHG